MLKKRCSDQLGGQSLGFALKSQGFKAQGGGVGSCACRISWFKQKVWDVLVLVIYLFIYLICSVSFHVWQSCVCAAAGAE